MEYDFKAKNVVYFVGNATLPKNTSVGKLYEKIALGMIVDVNTSKILDADITMANNLAKKFVVRQIVGRFLNQGLDEILSDLDRYRGPAQKSIIVALKAAYYSYECYIKNDV